MRERVGSCADPRLLTPGDLGPGAARDPAVLRHRGPDLRADRGAPVTQRILVFEVAGKLRRQENGPQGSWRKKAGYRKAWRTRVQVSALVETRLQRPIDPTTPKTVRVRARVFNLYDEAGLWSATKPVVDGLVDAGIIHSDRPTAQSGHRIVLSQGIDRKDEGVTIMVDEGVDV